MPPIRLYGQVALDPASLSLDDALADGGVVVERGLLARLGLALGDPLADRRGRVRDPRGARARAGPDRRLRQHRPARDDPPRGARAHPDHPAGLARPLRLWPRAAGGPRRRGRAGADPRGRPRGTLAGARHARRPAADRALHRSSRELPDARRAHRAADRRRRGRARDPELPRRQDHDHRDPQMPGRLERADLPGLPAAGAGAGRRRDPARPDDRHRGALALAGAGRAAAADPGRDRLVPAAAADRGRRRALDRAASSRSGRWRAPARSRRRRCSAR